MVDHVKEQPPPAPKFLVFFVTSEEQFIFMFKKYLLKSKTSYQDAVKDLDMFTIYFL